MFIEITKDVAELVSENDSNVMNKYSKIINDLLHSVRDSEHIAICDRETFKILQNCNTIYPDNKCILQWIQNKRFELKVIEDKVKIKVYIIAGEKSYSKHEGNCEIYCLSINDIGKICVSELLTENGYDYRFYCKICSFMYDENSVCTYNIHNMPLGGGTAGSIVKQANDENKFYLCITDSDKNYPNDGLGGTYKNAKESFDDATNIWPRYLMYINAMEKENLFPFAYYKRDCNNEQASYIDKICGLNNEDIFRYVKIKGGIKQKRLYEGNKDWQHFYSLLIDECKKSNIYHEQEDKDDFCVKGINSKMLDRASKDFFSTYDSYNELQEKSKIDEVFGTQKFILDDWKEIAQLIFDFGCCITRNEKYIV